MVDWEAVVADLRAFLVARHLDGHNSFGYRELTDLLQELQVKHRLEEGLPEKALRVYGSALREALVKNTPPDTTEADAAEAEMAVRSTGPAGIGPGKASNASRDTRARRGHEVAVASG